MHTHASTTNTATTKLQAGRQPGRKPSQRQGGEDRRAKHAASLRRSARPSHTCSPHQRSHPAQESPPGHQCHADRPTAGGQARILEPAGGPGSQLAQYVGQRESFCAQFHGTAAGDAEQPGRGSRVPGPRGVCVCVCMRACACVYVRMDVRCLLVGLSFQSVCLVGLSFQSVCLSPCPSLSALSLSRACSIHTHTHTCSYIYIGGRRRRSGDRGRDIIV